jgi:hypothetical protein
MRGDIHGHLGSVTKGEPGLSAYEIAVMHGFVGTEEDWLKSLSADAEPAQEAAESAEASARRAESARDAAEASAESAKSYQRAAETNEQASYDNRTAAAASAREATTAASSAAENAAYIAGRVNAAMISADQAAVSESHAEASAGRAWQSEANAKQSELMAAEYYIRVRDASGAASASAADAAESATRAANSAVQASTLISEFNANVELAHTYASISGGYANNSQAYAVAAADAANRAEEALGNALKPLKDYYNKEQVDSIVGAEASTRSGQVLSLNIAVQALQTAVADRYTKAEVNSIVAGVPHLKREVVTALPTTDIDERTIYMIQDGSVSGNAYAEYMYIDGQWEAIGTTETELADYEKKADIAPYKAKLDSIEAGAQVNTVTGVKGSDELNFRTGDISISKSDIGLGSVDNTSDSIKSVASASVASALDNSDRVSFSAGDVVFFEDTSPSSCYVCITGS